ncbi:MAG: O-antigen ligase family protein, partial [Opitutaceae bacterium]
MLPADSAPAAAPTEQNGANSAPTFGLSRAVGSIGVIALLAVTLAHPSATRLHTWPWALVTALLWSSPLVLLAIRFGAHSAWHRPGFLLCSGLGLLALGTIASACFSPFSAASLPRVWPTLGGVAFYFLLHDWLAHDNGSRQPRLGFLALLIAFGGAVIVGVSLIGWLRAVASGGWTVRNAIPFGHSNYTAGVMVLLLPWFVFHAWQSRGLARLGWCIVATAAIVALGGTSSRGAALALLVVSGSFVLATVAWAPWSCSRKLMLTALVIGVGLVTVLANPRLRELALRRNWGHSARESNRQRSAMLEAGARLGAERPLLGWGPGTVPLAYPRVRAQLDGGVDNILQLHNTPIQIWATLGATGGLALVLLTLGLGRQLAGALSTRLSSRPASLAALASLGGYCLFALTDHQFDLPIIAALAACNLAVLSSTGVPPVGLSRRPRIIAALSIAAFVVAPTFFLTRDLLARRAYEQSLVAWEHGR